MIGQASDVFAGVAGKLGQGKLGVDKANWGSGCKFIQFLSSSISSQRLAHVRGARQFQPPPLAIRNHRPTGGEAGCCRSGALPLTAQGTIAHWSSLNRTHYRSTLVARKMIAFGMVNPSALAVFMLTTSSNLVGRSNGRSFRFVPLRILSTCRAPRR